MRFLGNDPRPLENIAGGTFGAAGQRNRPQRHFFNGGNVSQSLLSTQSNAAHCTYNYSAPEII